MDKDLAIKVDKVYKDFLLPHERINSVKGIFTGLTKGSPWRLKETQHALKDISFEVKKGEFFGIVGRNGSGKSTLLKILANIYQPTKGSINVSGRLVPFIELGVGFNGELTGRENIYLNGAMLGFAKEEIDSMYEDIVSFAELERFMDQKLKNYSSGMQVRLAFSLATRAQADILLVDEVLAVGDADFQRKCFDYFKKLKKDKKTVVFVSHDMEAIKEYCDRVMLIDNNVTKNIGKPNKVAEQYNKLFSVATPEKEESNDPVDRWGTGKAKTIDVKVSVENNEILVSQSIKAFFNTERPVVGFRVRDAAGKEVTGTNNKLEGVLLTDIKAGETLKIEWRLANIFSDGKYIVDLAVQEANGITVIDWWDEAANFRVKKSRHIPYPIDPGFELKLL